VQLQLLLGLYAAVLGLIAGSYLNVVIYRLPRGLSTVAPRSRCPGCDALILPYDNVPLLSFLLLRGRCRRCGTPISWRYPLIEATTGLLFIACFARFGATVEAVAAALFCCLMVALAAIDVEHLILPDRITWPGIAVGIALQPWLGWARRGPTPLAALAGGVLGAAVGAGVLLAIWAAWYALRREEGMGLGDAKMLSLIGAFLGWRGALLALFLAALSGAVVGLALLARGRAGMRSKLPFGAFLALGGLVALFAGEAIVAGYASLL
jgi:leader peptidase (prepilin peptidase) / N-methyltransferase